MYRKERVGHQEKKKPQLSNKEKKQKKRDKKQTKSTGLIE